MRHVFNCETIRLDNGLRLLYVSLPAMPSVAVACFVGVGSRFEEEGQEGISHLTEHMLFKGTMKRQASGAVAQAIDAVGGILNASTDKELTTFWAKVAIEHFPLAVDVLSDMLLESRLRPGDINKEQRVVVEELRMLMDDPQDRVHVLAEELLWPDQPAGREIAGTPEMVMRQRRGQLRAFMQRFYRPHNVVISVAGGVSREEAVGLVSERFGGWQSGEQRDVTIVPAHFGAEQARVENKGSEQVHMCVEWPGLPRTHPDRAVLDVLCTLLGGGTSSRLFVSLRDRLGLAYDVHAYTTYLSDSGSIVVYAGIDASNVQVTIDEIFKEIVRLQRRRVPVAELERTKEGMKGRLWLGLEDPQSVAHWFGAQEILDHELVTPEQAAREIEAVTADQLRDLARLLLPVGAARVAAIGPVEQSTLPHVA